MKGVHLLMVGNVLLSMCSNSRTAMISFWRHETKLIRIRLIRQIPCVYKPVQIIAKQSESAMIAADCPHN